MYAEGQEGRCDRCGYVFQSGTTDTRDVGILVGLARYRCEECL